MTSAAPGAIDRRAYGAVVRHPRQIAGTDALTRAELEAEEILERAAQACAPLRRRDVARAATPSTAIVPDDRLVHPRQQLHERRLPRAVLADDRHDRSRRQRERHVVEHETRRARVRERDVIEADAPREPLRRGRVARHRVGGRVVFEPRETPRAVHPEAAQEPDFADRRADVRRQPRRRGEHEQHASGRRSKDRRHEHDRADIRGAEDRPRERVPAGRPPPRRGDRRRTRASTPRGGRARAARRCR